MKYCNILQYGAAYASMGMKWFNCEYHHAASETVQQMAAFVISDHCIWELVGRYVGMESTALYSKWLPHTRVDWWGNKRKQKSTTCYTIIPCPMCGMFCLSSIDTGTRGHQLNISMTSSWDFADEAACIMGLQLCRCFSGHLRDIQCPSKLQKCFCCVSMVYHRMPVMICTHYMVWSMKKNLTKIVMATKT